jgi:hypothetical protein
MSLSQPLPGHTRQGGCPVFGNTSNPGLSTGGWLYPPRRSLLVYNDLGQEAEVIKQAEVEAT